MTQEGKHHAPHVSGSWRRTVGAERIFPAGHSSIASPIFGAFLDTRDGQTPPIVVIYLLWAISLCYFVTGNALK